MSAVLEALRPPPTALARLADSDGDNRDDDCPWDEAERVAFVFEGRDLRLRDIVTEVDGKLFWDTQAAPWKLREAADSPDIQMRRTAAGVSRDPEIIERLARDPVWEVRAAVATNPRVTAPAAARLAKDGSVRVKSHLILNVHAPEPSRVEASHRLSDTQTWEVLSHLDVPLPADLFRKHVNQDQGPALRPYPMDVVNLLVGHPSCPPDVIGELMEHHARGGYGVTLEAVAKHPNCPPAALVRLADDPTVGRRVLSAVAAHPNTPPASVGRLSRHHNDRVVAEALRNPNCPATAIRSVTAAALRESSWKGWSIASNPSAPPDLLAWLADDLTLIVGPDYYPEARDRLAQNPGTPTTVIDRFADELLPGLTGGDRSRTIPFYGIVRNPSVSTHVLQEVFAVVTATYDRELQLLGSLTAQTLIIRGDRDLLRALTESPERHLRYLATTLGGPDTARQLSSDPVATVRRNAARFVTDPDTLSRLAEDADTTVRATVARNPDTPRNAMDRLIWDDTPEVRRVARVQYRDRYGHPGAA